MAHVKPHIPNSLKRYRRIANYSQKQVAILFGYKTASRISLWEKGETLPGLVNLFHLCFLYRVHPLELYADLWQGVREKLRKKKLRMDEMNLLKKPK